MEKQKNTRELLVTFLGTIITELGGGEVGISLDRPSDPTHGDYTTNVSFSLAKQLKKSPMEVAEEIVEKCKEQKEKSKELEKVEAVKPGFVNFYLSESFLSNALKDLLSGKKEDGKEAVQKIMVEFTDPNPFKEFHIGHLYSLIVGESISRLLEAQGNEVKRATYQGDVGLHVAKSLWGMMQLAETMPNEADKPSEKAAYLGKCYALGATKYEEDEAAKAEMIALNKKVYSREDEEVNKLYDIGKKWSLDYFDDIYHRVGTHFWRNYFESEAGPVGLAIVKEHMKDGIFEEHEGAVVFRGEPYGLHTRVFINSLGLPTYEAKELGLAPTKYKEYEYDRSVIITGNEINEYFKVLLKVLSLINPELASKTTHMSHGMVRLPEGKMSSRTGKIVTGEWLLNEAVKKAEEMGKESVSSRESAEQVGIGAIKYAFLKSSIGKDVEFDFDSSLSLNGNSGPYLQYSFVRTQSILQKAEKAGIEANYPSDYTPNPVEKDLLRQLVMFSEVVEDAAVHFSPSNVCTYLYELAKSFNGFYQSERIVDAATSDEQVFRVGLTKAVGMVLESGLGLLGIEAPKRM